MAAYHTLSAETNPLELKPMQRSPFDFVSTLQGGGVGGAVMDWWTGGWQKDVENDCGD